jgi:hypothetical protein
VVQGPHGRQFTINTTAQTEWEGDASLSALTTNSIVLISGQLDKADHTLDADEVAILSQSGFYAGGLVTYVTPATAPPGQASGLGAGSFDLYVRGLLPANTGVQLGDIAQVNLSGSETYEIYWMHNRLTQFLFNLSSGLLAGQDVAVGGPASGAANASAVTVNRITLRHRGYIGTVVANSESGDTFQMNINGFAGVVIANPVNVQVGSGTDFRFGCGGLSTLANSPNNTIRVVGLLVKDPATGAPVLLARHVDWFDFTNFGVVSSN